jgi:hypothetical protein
MRCLRLLLIGTEQVYPVIARPKHNNWQRLWINLAQTITPIMVR